MHRFVLVVDCEEGENEKKSETHLKSHIHLAFDHIRKFGADSGNLRFKNARYAFKQFRVADPPKIKNEDVERVVDDIPPSQELITLMEEDAYVRANLPDGEFNINSKEVGVCMYCKYLTPNGWCYDSEAFGAEWQPKYGDNCRNWSPVPREEVKQRITKGPI